MKLIFVGILIVALCVGVSSGASYHNWYSSVSLSPVTGPTAPGYVEFHMLANPSQDNTIYAKNDLQTDGNWSKITLPSDGNQRETQHFKIGGGDTTRVVFIGCAISEPVAPVVTPTPIPCTRPVASFIASTTTIHVGESVQFTDTSRNKPNKRMWSFDSGDYSISNVDSTEKNPSWTFNKPGVFSVGLIASNDAGTSAIINQQYIHVLGGQ
jgi:PKD repeat protein